MSTNREKPGSAGGEKASDDKARRLAEALRQNLRRRKAQARARSIGGTEDGGAATPDDAANRNKG